MMIVVLHGGWQKALTGKARRRSEKFTSVLKSQYFNDVKNYVYFGYRDTEY